ncbi:hypothetical protein SAMN04488067_12311 [Halorubrum xinjiangense]|uniref:Uncharacterized protein n=1 Tax=Halorubrum xinjiangense TaxID=261291 RepID=A0A1G7SRF0_9EURY|nr:hypothetical protein SAMN04488067_12311 [Halorubrum xinjiangense]
MNRSTGMENMGNRIPMTTTCLLSLVDIAKYVELMGELTK